MRSLTIALLSLSVCSAAFGQAWSQWGRNAGHDGNAPVVGLPLERIDAQIVLDPFADIEKAQGGNRLLVHYQAPLVDGADLYLVVKSGTYTSRTNRESQTWNVTNVRRVNGQYVTRWTYASDWKPVPFGSADWEPVYHVALTSDAVLAPGAGGTIDRISRETGARLQRISPPFESTTSAPIFVSGPPTVAESGDIYYNAIQLLAGSPWASDPPNSWLVRIAPDGTPSIATFASLTPNAPGPNDQCTTSFSNADLPWPPSPNAVAPTTRCGAQRPGINVAPAVAPDGTVYTISRAHLNDRYGYLVATNPDLTPKWSSTLRERFNDGCNVSLPSNGPAGCRLGSLSGVDPAENRPGSGRVNDNGTSSPVVAPDGNIIYGAWARYNYLQGHLMMFDPSGNFLRFYEFGWDITPAIYPHNGTYSVILKENRYGVFNRSTVTPMDPEQYFITSLDPNFNVEWQFKNTETRSCSRGADGVVNCSPPGQMPNNFEWCVNAVAVDARGMVYANAEDGFLYAIRPDGTLSQRIFLRLALGAAYTPLSIGSDGRIYTQNDGVLFVISGFVRRRPARS